MSFRLDSLKGGYIGDYIGIKGDTRSLDYSSYGQTERLFSFQPRWHLKIRVAIKHENPRRGQKHGLGFRV